MTTPSLSSEPLSPSQLSESLSALLTRYPGDVPRSMVKSQERQAPSGPDVVFVTSERVDEVLSSFIRDIATKGLGRAAHEFSVVEKLPSLLPPLCIVAAEGQDSSIERESATITVRCPPFRLLQRDSVAKRAFWGVLKTAREALEISTAPMTP